MCDWQCSPRWGVGYGNDDAVSDALYIHAVWVLPHGQCWMKVLTLSAAEGTSDYSIQVVIPLVHVQCRKLHSWFDVHA